MNARVVRMDDYMKGYPYIVMVAKDSWHEYIDSWHKTKREANATARDIQEISLTNQQGDK
jgi:hypothetical protein